MDKLILHIPHSSIIIPSMKGFVVKKEVLDKEIIKLTDWYTDDLFLFTDSIVVRADFSRVFCDAERFANDQQEVMAQYGMGVLYEKADDGSAIRDVTPKLREEVLTNYYWPHHKKLNQAVEAQLKKFGKALIVDCHSFPSKPFIRDLDQRKNRPDFNIGTDSYHTPGYLIDLSKNYFEDNGYSTGIDWPYSGSIVPLRHYRKSKNVTSIMLEINRALYLKEPGNEKSNQFNKIKGTVSDYLEMLKSNFSNL